ncbi:hypothetical protein FAF44_00690 [Nonomuraea sp. MG754425]|uniref:hypothetical protein n=1 Tax=Nonomuraea sp. MG754425 TaxID=2570319 RepID=UPI001F409073|nr:hypothetical protein [Nonomuraea sp. MG754425]MCF6466932.1 hypothetical protein [Nonomuraea sp. MG754425]
MLTRITRMIAITAALGAAAALSVAAPASADISFADCNDYGGMAVPRQVQAHDPYTYNENDPFGITFITVTEYWCVGGNNGGQKIAWRN